MLPLRVAWYQPSGNLGVTNATNADHRPKPRLASARCVMRRSTF